MFRNLNPSALSAVAGITALVGAFKGLVSIGQNVIGVVSHFEQTEKGLETVLQSAQKGQALFEDLRKFSFDTTFGIDELASASTQLLNTGRSVETLKDDLKMLGDLAQGNKGKFAELTSIFGKVMSQGKATSMQLNQIALRGIPIKKVLQEMGVTGVASAEDLTNAFKKLTEEGGQFHNAMNNIIDTIEGKQGFISDTLKEIAVNFANVTGITDAYKSSLDMVYKILNSVNDKLREWNENPVIKGIISGVFASAITMLVTLIGVGLVGALKLVLVKLGEIQLMSGWVGWISLAVSGIIGLVAGLKSARSAQNELKNEISETTIALNEQRKAIENGDGESLIKSLIEQKKKDIEELQNDLETFKLDTVSNTFANSWDLKQIERLKNDISGLENALEGFSVMRKGESIVNELLPKALGTDERVLSLQNEIKALKEYRELKDSFGLDVLSDDAKKDVDIVINYLTNELNKLQKGEKLQKTWKQFWEEVTGVKVGEGKGNISAGRMAGIDYRKSIQEQLGLDLKINDAVGNGIEGRKNIVSDYISTLEDNLKELLHAKDLDENFTMADESIEELINTIGWLKNELKILNEEGLKQTVDEVKKINEASVTRKPSTLSGLADYYRNISTDEDGYVKDSKNYLKSTLLGSVNNSIGSSDVGNAIDSLMMGLSPLETLLNILIQDVFKVIGGIDGVNTVLSPVKQILKELEPVFKLAVMVVSTFTQGLVKIIQFLTGTKGFQKFKEDIDSAWVEFVGTTEDATQSMQALNQQLKSLTEAQKEQEEYYINQKKQINSDSYRDSVYNVNDMILTPQGNFSTAPDDYIIATKNPNSLGGNINVKIINNAGVDVQTSQGIGEGGVNELLVTLSRKVASDVARGINGWDNAFTARTRRINGIERS